MNQKIGTFRLRAPLASTLATALLAIGMVGIQVPATAATWTFTPELRRLDAEGNELPAVQMEVERDETLRVGLFVNVSSDGAQPGAEAVLGFESFIGAIHFYSDEMGLSDIAPVVKALRGGRGWERRLENTSFDGTADRWLGPPEESENETSWISFWSDATNVQDSHRGAWCVAEGGACRIFVGVLNVPVGSMPAAAAGMDPTG
ncbi:MAG: hypothetical protein F4053_16030, partial [Proteobacteria bacterium]|nr:hypothetical protein [Pseudomonadota bacterium]